MISKNIGKGKYTVIAHKEHESGYGGQCLELLGAISEGETIKELKDNMTDVIQLVLQSIEPRSSKSRNP